MGKNNKKINRQMSGEIKHHLLRRLVHVVVGNEENVASLAIDFFIEQALIEIGNNKSQREIVRGVQQIFLLSFSSEEVAEALLRLHEGGNIVSSNNKYTLELSRAEVIRNKNNEISWICRGDCGNEKISKTHYLNNGETWHCGCSIIYKTKPFENLINRKFGSLFVLEKLENDKRGLARWKCKCDCGNISIKKQNT